MGRRRKKDLYLPKRMYRRRGKYYFDSPTTGQWEPLGGDYTTALQLYGKLAGPIWAGRTLADLFTRYKTEITAVIKSEDTRDNEIRTLDRFNRVFGHMNQDMLTQQHLYKYMDERLDERPEFIKLKRKAPSAARHDVRFLKKVLTKGIKWGVGTVNPVIGLEFDADPDDARDVTPEEFQAVYGLANERVQIAMDLADVMGQRRGDILDIHRDHLTEEGILVNQGKTGAYLLLEWTPALRAVVARAQALQPHIPREYLLRNRVGQPYTKDGFNSMWQRLMKKATSPGKNGEPPALAKRFKFHHLRKKAATDKAVETTEEEAQKLMGHAKVGTTRKNYIQPRGRKPTRARPAR